MKCKILFLILIYFRFLSVWWPKIAHSYHINLSVHFINISSHHLPSINYIKPAYFKTLLFLWWHIPTFYVSRTSREITHVLMLSGSVTEDSSYGGLIGGVIAAVVIIALILLGVLFLRRNIRSKSNMYRQGHDHRMTPRSSLRSHKKR